MHECLVCHRSFVAPIGLKMIFQPKQARLCLNCAAQLKPVTGCERCNKQLTEADRQVCLDCLRWAQLEGGDSLALNRSLYQYNDFLKQLLADYKYRGDAALGEIFIEDLKKEIKRHFPTHELTAIPLSSQRLKERSFNQAELLLGNLKWHPCLSRALTIDDRKQSKKTRAERINWFKENPFSVLEKEFSIIKGKDYLIIDDIYTTGVTVRQAASKLIQAGANSVSSLTIARS